MAKLASLARLVIETWFQLDSEIAFLHQSSLFAQNFSKEAK
jgi:hypothetical protein